LWKHYRTNSTILSSTCRQLALGIGGICWWIKSSANYQSLSCEVINLLILVVLFFIADIVQYLIATIGYKNKASEYDEKIKSNEIKSKSQLIEPEMINSAAKVAFAIKLFILAVASLDLIYIILKI
jgi:uncharacterized membrane protein